MTPTYNTIVDFPGMPAGELLWLDDSDPANAVYRGITHTDFWMEQSIVENDPTKYQAL